MTTPRSIFVVVPAFNEAAALPHTLAPLVEAGYTVVAVDDGSGDGTWEALGRLPVFRLRHSTNLGQGAALATGLEFARRRGAAVAVTFDADGQHDAARIPALAAPILEGHTDVVFGSRFLDAAHARHVPPLRRIILKGGIVVNALATGLWLTDAHNGFRALSPVALEKIHLRENGFAHATEILDQVRRAGLRYREIPVEIRYTGYSRAKGQSSLNCLSILFDLALRRVFP